MNPGKTYLIHSSNVWRVYVGRTKDGQYVFECTDGSLIKYTPSNMPAMTEKPARPVYREGDIVKVRYAKSDDLFVEAVGYVNIHVGNLADKMFVVVKYGEGITKSIEIPEHPSRGSAVIVAGPMGNVLEMINAKVDIN